MYFPRVFSAAPVEPSADASVAWEEVACLLCGGSHSQPLVEAPDFQGRTELRFVVAQCQDCGLCYTNPRPKGRSLAQFYPADYAPHRIPPADPSLRRRRTPFPWRGEGRLLDFGCGGGKFLRLMRSRGWDVTGIDLAHDVVERLRIDHGLRVFAGTLPHEDLPPESFDVITMWQSLEHVPHPKRVLVEARRLLAPEGRLYVAVPNIDSLGFRVFGSSWSALDLPRHMVHFTPWTLQLMLERSGFAVERLRMLSKSGWLRDSARVSRPPYAGWMHRALRWRWWSRLVGAYAAFTGQAEAILAVARIRESL